MFCNEEVQINPNVRKSQGWEVYGKVRRSRHKGNTIRQGIPEEHRGGIQVLDQVADHPNHRGDNEDAEQVRDDVEDGLSQAVLFERTECPVPWGWQAPTPRGSVLGRPGCTRQNCFESTPFRNPSRLQCTIPQQGHNPPPKPAQINSVPPPCPQYLGIRPDLP